MTVLDLEIPGEPVPKGRPRMGRGGHVYTPAATRVAEEWVSRHLRAAWRGDPSKGFFDLHLVFRLGHYRRYDFDNLAKLVVDAGNGLVWDDDSQILGFSTSVQRGHSTPSTRVMAWETVEPLPSGSKCRGCRRPLGYSVRVDERRRCLDCLKRQ